VELVPPLYWSQKQLLSLHYGSYQNGNLLLTQSKLERLAIYLERLNSVLRECKAPPWEVFGDLLFRKFIACSPLLHLEESLLESALISLRREYNFGPLFSKAVDCGSLVSLSDICSEFTCGFIAGLASFLYDLVWSERSQDSKRSELALDGLQIYAPVAEAVGLRSMQVEMEDLCFSILNPVARSSVLAILSNLERSYAGVVSKVLTTLSSGLCSRGIKHQISWRKKTPYSIWFKMLSRQKSFAAVVPDVIAFRIIVDEIANCYEALNIVHSAYKAVYGELEDFISSPKANQYKSIHTIVLGPLGYKIEVQIRTSEMHSLAEHGLASHWLYKRGIYHSMGSKGLTRGVCPHGIFK
jgi:hypothetical protein